jgi:ADP-heptose:LPS heptosyltransferase
MSLEELQIKPENGSAVKTAILISGGVRETLFAQPAVRGLPGAIVFAPELGIRTLNGLEVERAFQLGGSFRDWLRAYGWLRTEPVGVAVLPPPVDFDRAVLAFFSGIPRRLTLPGPQAWSASQIEQRRPGMHPVDGSRHLAAAVTRPNRRLIGSTEAPRVQAAPSARLKLQQRGLSLGRGYIVIIPGRGNWTRRPAQRHWLPERLAVVANQLDGDSVVVVAGAGEDKIAREVRADIKLPSEVVKLDDYSVEEFAALTESGRMVIGHDGDALHLAAAAGARVFALLGSSDIVPFGETSTAIQIDDFNTFQALRVVSAIREPRPVGSYA